MYEMKLHVKNIDGNEDKTNEIPSDNKPYPEDVSEQRVIIVIFSQRVNDGFATVVHQHDGDNVLYNRSRVRAREVHQHPHVVRTVRDTDWWNHRE